MHPAGSNYWRQRGTQSIVYPPGVAGIPQETYVAPRYASPGPMLDPQGAYGPLVPNGTESHAEKYPAKVRGPKRRLVVCRHGERVDFTFGRDWIKEHFDSSGRYCRRDLNMPKGIITRPGGLGDFLMDSPLTNIGHYQAVLTGENLREAGVRISCVYASPSLRCVETAGSLLEGMRLKVPIRLEPGLFEWLGYYAAGLPRFLNPTEYEAAGYNIDMTYVPLCTLGNLQECMKESVEQYYNRERDVTRSFLQRESRDTLVVAHATSLDACVRQLLGKKPRSTSGFKKAAGMTPYLGTVSIEEQGSDEWEICPLALSGSVLHQGNPPFNSAQFLSM